MLCNERLCPGTFIYICVKTEDENGKRRKKDIHRLYYRQISISASCVPGTVITDLKSRKNIMCFSDLA